MAHDGSYYNCNNCGDTVDDEYNPWDDCDVCGRVFCTSCLEDNPTLLIVDTDGCMVCQECHIDESDLQ